MDDRTADVAIYSIPWNGDHEADVAAGEKPNSIIRCRVAINGVEIPNVIAAETSTSEGFGELTIRILPSSIRHISVPSALFYADELPPNEQEVSQ